MFKSDIYRKGLCSEQKVQLYFLEKGYDVFTPIGGRTKCDFVACKPNETIRVQVKTASENGNGLQVRFDVNGKVQNRDTTDVYVVVYEDNMWMFPVEDCQQTSRFMKHIGKFDKYKIA